MTIQQRLILTLVDGEKKSPEFSRIFPQSFPQFFTFPEQIFRAVLVPKTIQEFLVISRTSGYSVFA